eukprot:6646544-Pyramimonas_sp.AAC.1
MGAHTSASGVLDGRSAPKDCDVPLRSAWCLAPLGPPAAFGSGDSFADCSAPKDCDVPLRSDWGLAPQDPPAALERGD